MPPTLQIDRTPLRAGMRLAVGLSGGADSVALLCRLHELAPELGLVLYAAHLHHGLRGQEADRDQDFCRELCERKSISFLTARVEVAREAEAQGESIEAAARRLRYAWFRELLSKKLLHAVLTAHTSDDQAETVLAKLLRGAWTEGLSGIHPVVEFPEGRVIRPMLGCSRAQVEAYLRAMGQSWCEDSSNQSKEFTRNRIRHELLPALEAFNPQVRQNLCQMATLARDEDFYLSSEVARLAPELLLRGRPVRGGGRASGETIALDVTRLAALSPALQRRLLRYACAELGPEPNPAPNPAPNFETTEALRALALRGRGGQKLPIEGGVLAERTPRELRLGLASSPAAGLAEYEIPVPGRLACPDYGLELSIELAAGAGAPAPTATLRPVRPGDRVRLRYSASPKKIKEILERLRVPGPDRAGWPVLELTGEIVWMQGAELEPRPGIRIEAHPLE